MQDLVSPAKKSLRGIEADKGEGVTSDLSGKWREVAMSLIETFCRRLVATGGMWQTRKRMPSLRRAMGKVAGLNKAVSKAKGAPEEEGLRDLG